MTYAPATFEVATPNGLGQMHLQENIVLGLGLGVKVTRDAARHPLHHVTYAFAKLGDTSSNGSGDAFTKIYSI